MWYMTLGRLRFGCPVTGAIGISGFAVWYAYKNRNHDRWFRNSAVVFFLCFSNCKELRFRACTETTHHALSRPSPFWWGDFVLLTEQRRNACSDYSLFIHHWNLVLFIWLCPSTVTIMLWISSFTYIKEDDFMSSVCASFFCPNKSKFDRVPFEIS